MTFFKALKDEEGITIKQMGKTLVVIVTCSIIVLTIIAVLGAK